MCVSMCIILKYTNNRLFILLLSRFLQNVIGKVMWIHGPVV